MDSIFGELGESRSSRVRMFGRKWTATSRSDWAYDDEFQDATSSSISDEELAASRRNRELAKRLVTLEANYFEDYGRELKAGSKAGFEAFMKSRHDIQLPLLGAEESGVIVATWTSGAECLSIRFVERYSLDFAVSYSTPQGPKRKWGRSTLVTVFGECPHARRLTTSG